MAHQGRKEGGGGLSSFLAEIIFSRSKGRAGMKPSKFSNKPLARGAFWFSETGRPIFAQAAMQRQAENACKCLLPMVTQLNNDFCSSLSTEERAVLPRKREAKPVPQHPLSVCVCVCGGEGSGSGRACFVLCPSHMN